MHCLMEALPVAQSIRAPAHADVHKCCKSVDSGRGSRDPIHSMVLEHWHVHAFVSTFACGLVIYRKANDA